MAKLQLGWSSGPERFKFANMGSYIYTSCAFSSGSYILSSFRYFSPLRLGQYDPT